MMYDLVIVGSGLYGAVSAYLAHKRGLRCIVLERRSAVGGNVRDELQEGIHVHKYGPHIFHTNNKEVWDFANKFAEFNHFRYCPLVRSGKQLYDLPFNIKTFYEVYGVKTLQEAKMQFQKEQENEFYEHPINLEQQTVSLVGRKFYDLLIKDYIEKQWGKKASELSASYINKLPLKVRHNNNYFNDRYQGIPIGGYSSWIKKMLDGIEVRLNTDFIETKEYWENQSKQIIYTGAIDEFYDYKLGALEYRSLRFEEKLYHTEDYQGCATVNEISPDIPYTRTIEHKHFESGKQPVTIVTREYPAEWHKGADAFYPVNNEKNNWWHHEYRKMAAVINPSIRFCGQLGDYRYYNMDEVIERAMKSV